MVAHLRVTLTFRCGQLQNGLSAHNKLYKLNWQNVNVGIGISGRQNLVFVWPSLSVCVAITHSCQHFISHQSVNACTSKLLTRKKTLHFTHMVYLCISSGSQNQYTSFLISCDFDRASSLICGNKMPTRCNRGFYCRSYCLLNMLRASLCPSSGAQEYYTVVAVCGILCCGFSSSWSGVELRVMCPDCRMLQHPANRTHNPQLHTRPAT